MTSKTIVEPEREKWIAPIVCMDGGKVMTKNVISEETPWDLT
jgi:hypothetical protein